MLRLLRQYNRYILGIFGVLLLVSWGLSGTMSSLSQYSAREGSTWATYGVKNARVTMGDLEQIQNELAVVEQLQRIAQRKLLPIPDADKDPAHWYLLTREADEAGLVGGDHDANTILDSLATGFTAQMGSAEPITSDQAAAILAGQAKTSPLLVRHTLAKLRGVGRLHDVLANVPRTSDARLRHSAVEALLAVAGDVVVLDARKLTQPEVPEPTEDELKQQLAAFGDKEPGKGDRGFGYRLPDRLKMEWLQISQGAVRAAVERGGGLDALTLKRKFAENPARYGAMNLGSDPLASFPAYEASVRKTVTDELVAAKLAEIVKFANDQMAQALRGLKRTGSYYILPEDWPSRRPSLKEISIAITNEFGIAAPAYGMTGSGWMSISEIATLPGVGTATSTRFSEKPTELPKLLEKLKEFSHHDEAMPMQADVVSPPLNATGGDVYFVRVLATDPSRPPADIAEAGPALVNDVKAINRYSALVKLEPEIEAQAKAESPSAIAQRFGATLNFVPRLAEASTQTISFGVKFPGQLPELGSDADAVKKIIDFASELPKTKPASDLAPAERTITFALDKRLAIVTMRISELFPLTSEDYETVVANPRAQTALQGQNGILATNEALSLPALTKRHNFKLIRTKSSDTSETASTTTTTTDDDAG